MPSRTTIIMLCIACMIGGLILDIHTPQQFFAAIVWFVPIALSGLAFSKRFTLSLVVASVLLGFLVSALNANAEGGLDTIALLNRMLLAGTSVLVGVMTIHLSTFSQQLGQAQERESKVRLERDIERIAGKIASAPTLQIAFEQILPMLSQMLGAKGVLMAAVQNHRLQEPYAALNIELEAYQLGQILTKQVPVSEKHSDQKIWVLRLEQAELVLILLTPNPNRESHLRHLEPVLTRSLERVRLLENLSQQQILLERRNSVIRDLVYAFSHDLRTPLMANAMNIKLALDGAFGELPIKYLRSLENGLTANQDLLKLADELLLVARFESGEANPQSEIIHLPQALQAMMMSLETLARASEVEFVTQLHSIFIQGNSLDIRRLLQNLLDNAIKHSPQHGIIGITLQPISRHNQTFARLEISDTGKGISPKIETHLFTRFSSPRAGGGSGLGLYLAKRIVEAHQGKIGYTRTEKTIFWVELPAKTE